MPQDITPESLVNNHSDYLLSFAMTKLNDIDLAKDIVQDTLVSALTNLSTFERKAKLRTWLTSILNRKIIDYWRKAETRYTDPVSSFFDQDDKAKHWIENKSGSNTASTVLEEMSQKETFIELDECIATIPKKWQGIITSKYIDRKESDIICNDFDVSSSNLWVIMHRAKLLLRECLENKWRI